MHRCIFRGCSRLFSYFCSMYEHSFALLCYLCSVVVTRGTRAADPEGDEKPESRHHPGRGPFWPCMELCNWFPLSVICVRLHRTRPRARSASDADHDSGLHGGMQVVTFLHLAMFPLAFFTRWHLGCCCPAPYCVSAFIVYTLEQGAAVPKEISPYVNSFYLYVNSMNTI